MKLVSIFLLSLAFVSFCFAQEKPTAILIDRFDNLLCGDFLGRLDNFFIDLQNEPASKGYAVIYTRENLSKESLWRLNAIGGHVDFRKLDPDRLSIVRAKKETDLEFEFWKIRAGADKPSFGEEWPAVLPSSTKPFIFANTFFDTICPNISPRDLVKLLTANPDFRLNLAVYQTPRQAKKESVYWIKHLTENYNIPRDRLKIFYGKPNRFYGTEFWIVPAKKKK